METQPTSHDPIIGNVFNSASSIYNLLFDKLISLDSKDVPSPALAESWTLGSEMKSLTLKIRAACGSTMVRCSTRAALKFNIDRVSAAGSKAPVSAFATDIASVENGCWAKPG